MNLNPRDILFRCGATDLARYGRLTRTTVPEELTGYVFKETMVRASTKYVFGPDGILRGVGANLPGIDWVDASTPTVLLEAARTNIVLWNRDLTNAAWTKTNVSAVKDQTGIDGVASSASRITASAGNGTCLQAIVLASSARFQTCYIKRLVGSGTIQMTTDNGSTWTTVTVTAAWTRVSIPPQTLANPTVGFRIVTNADSVAIDFVQNENGIFASSPIAVTTVAVTRSADTLDFPFYYEPQALWVYVKWIERGATLLSDARFWTIGGPGFTAPYLSLQQFSGGPGIRAIADGGGGLASTTYLTPGAVGVSHEALVLLSSTGTVQARLSIAGAADVATAVSGASALGAAWNGTNRILIGYGNGIPDGFQGLIRLMVGLGTPTSIADVRSLP